MNRVIYLIFTILLIFIQTKGQNQDSPEVTVYELKEHVHYLASDELEGRYPGTDGIRKAAEYIREQIKRLDVITKVDDYYQHFEILKDIKLGNNNSLVFKEFNAVINEDFIPLAISESASLTTTVVFVGYGFVIDEDSLKWNDYESVDVKDKWVMIFRGSPDYKEHNDKFENYSSLRKKILTARDNGAAGILFVSGEQFDAEDKLSGLSFERRETSVGLPVVHIKRGLADKILSGSNNSITELEKTLSEEKMNNSFEIKTKLSAEIDLVQIYAKTKNVTAVIPGSDPILKNEFILIGAHYDHLGLGGPGSGSRVPDTIAVHNGADDNASGTAAIIEIFERLASQRNNLKRSVIFMAFSAEEMGLLGSKFFTNNPFVDLSKIKFMFNLDMVGRLDSVDKNLTIGGTGTAAGLEELINKHVISAGLNVKFNSEGYGPSDHASFYAKDIPVMFVFSGIHDDYHTPRDDAHLINYEGQKLIADLVYEIAFDIINLGEHLVFQEAGPKEPQSTSRRLKVTLGIMPDFSAGSSSGVRADAVIEGRPAANAGMQKGDTIIAMDGKEVKDIYDYMNRLSQFKSGDRINVDVIRNGERIILIIDL